MQPGELAAHAQHTPRMTMADVHDLALQAERRRLPIQNLCRRDTQRVASRWCGTSAPRVVYRNVRYDPRNWLSATFASRVRLTA